MAVKSVLGRISPSLWALGRRIYSWEKVENPLDDAALKKKETVAGSKRRKARGEKVVV